MTHWKLEEANRTACGIMAYPSNVTGEYDTALSGRIECDRNPSCKTCRKVMKLDGHGGVIPRPIHPGETGYRRFREDA